jgi:signal peptidase I
MSDKKKLFNKSETVLEEVLDNDIQAESSSVMQGEEEVVETESLFEDVVIEETPAVSSTEEEVLTDADLKKDENSNKNKVALFLYDLVSVIMSSFIIIAIVFAFLFRLVGVDGESMTNTLQHGDWLLTYNKTEYVQGDIIVITQETYFQKPLIKRVIAVENDLIDINFETGDVTVNGVLLTENYIAEPTYRSFADGPDFPVIVPEGHVFVMGDNRNNSLDSRSDDVGFIDVRTIVGKMVYEIGGGN